MSLLKSREVILEIERTCDVNALRYNGLQIWPLIRSNIRVILERPEYKPAQEKPRGDLNCVRINPDPEQLGRFELLDDPDFMFVSLPEKHSIRMSGGYYNPWIDSYIDTIRDRYRYLKAEILTSLTRQTQPRCIGTTFLYVDASCFHIPYAKGCIKDFEQVREQVFSLCGADIDEAWVVREANAVEQYRLFYLDVLGALRPKVACHVCWYGAPAMGLIWACRDLNITSVDLQHAYHAGHLQYEDWSNLPSNGYELLPDIFHVWSHSFKRDIEISQTTDCPRHKAVVGNNAWMCKALHGEVQIDRVEGVDVHFLAGLQERARVILVTLPPTPDPLPVHLLQAIKKLPDNWLWLMRCHPKYRDRQQEVIEILDAHGIDNYEIRNSTQCPLFLLLERSTHHLTALSAVCLEALLYGVPTTFFFREAYERYHKHLEAGFFNCVPSSSDDLVKLLSLDYDKTEIRRLSEYFLDMDKQTGRRAFDEILAYSERREFQPMHENLRAINSNQAGMQFVEQGDLEGAMHSFWNAVKAEPTSTKYLNNLAVVCSSLGRSDDAVRCVKAALRINPEDERSVNNYRELVRAGLAVEPMDPADVCSESGP